MHFSARSKVGGLLSLLVLIMIFCAFVFNGLFSHATVSHAASAPAYNATKGILVPSATVNLKKLPATNLSYATGVQLPRGIRHIHRLGVASSVSNGQISSSSITHKTDGLVKKFNGVSSLDSAVTNFGAEFEPPDQGLCVGNGFVLEAVNSAFTIYHTNGSVVTGPFNVNVLFHEGLTEFTSDPRCYFDKSTNTWFAIILFISSDNTIGRTDLAVNSSGDPTTTWTVYHINGTDKNGPGCPCFGDQPLLGIDQKNVYISTNEFPIAVIPGFNGAQIYAISKSELVALAKSVHLVHFGNLSIGGAIAASVQPAISYGNPEAEYFMNSLDPTGTFDNRIGVWAMTDRQDVSEGGMPKLSSVVITSEQYGVPPAAEQKGAGSLLDSGDDRMQQVQYINGNLWGELTTGVTIPNDTAQRAGAAWFKVQPQLNASGKLINKARIANQGYVVSSGNYLIYPAIQASPNGTAAIVMTLTGSNYFPSVVYTRLQQNAKAFGAIHIALNGTGPYDPLATRWGDYSWAILDPDTNNFWMATEYIPPVSSQTTDGLRNWGTGVIEVSAKS
ncbi:MAG: hypothetical protein ACXWOL_14605 [Ktedonobacteraceae bacterium]